MLKENFDLIKKKVIEASFFSCPVEYKRTFNQSKCLMPISIDQKRQHGNYLDAIVKLMNKNFKECTLLLADSLKRITLKLELPNETEENLYKEVMNRGDRWLDKNQIVLTNFEIPYKITRWDDILNNPLFNEKLGIVSELYHSNEDYKEAIDHSAREYLERCQKRNDNSSNYEENALNICVQYLIEECAGMILWADFNCEFELYPTIRTRALTASYEHLIKPNYPSLLKPLSLRFKKYTKTHKNFIDIKTIMGNVPGHIYWKNKDGVYLGCNDRQAKNLGFNNAEEVIGKTDFDLPWSSSARQIKENDDQVMKSGIYKKILEESIVGDKKVFFISEKTPIRNENNEVIGVFGVSVDITEQKELEKKLNETINLQSEFIYNMEHDIRTPISGMALMSKLLMERETDETKKNELKLLYKASEILLNYCEKIIDFSNIERNSKPIIEEIFDLYKIINDVISLEMPNVLTPDPKKGKGILKLESHIKPNVPRFLIGDKYRLSRILLNLISNAVKFTKEGFVKITTLVSENPQKDEKAVITFVIEDSGIGISEEKKNIIFQKFQRCVKSNQEIYCGEGLGLTIVKKFVEEMGGEHSFESIEGKGTTFVISFTFKIPLNEITPVVNVN